MLELIIACYLITVFAAFLRNNFLRQVAIKTEAAPAIDADVREHEVLWEVRHKFESLFKDQTTRENALKMFPVLHNLAPEPHGEKPDAHSIPRVVFDSVLWPVMAPINASNKAADNVVASRQKDKIGQYELYNTLANYETDPELKEIFKKGNPDEIGAAMFEKALRDNHEAKVLEIENPEPTDDPFNLSGIYQTKEKVGAKPKPHATF